MVLDVLVKILLVTENKKEGPEKRKTSYIQNKKLKCSSISPEKRYFFSGSNFYYFSIETYIRMASDEYPQSMFYAIQMRTYYICFYGDIWKNIPKLTLINSKFPWCMHFCYRLLSVMLFSRWWKIVKYRITLFLMLSSPCVRFSIQQINCRDKSRQKMGSDYF